MYFINFKNSIDTQIQVLKDNQNYILTINIPNHKFHLHHVHVRTIMKLMFTHFMKNNKFIPYKSKNLFFGSHVFNLRFMQPNIPGWSVGQG